MMEYVFWGGAGLIALYLVARRYSRPPVKSEVDELIHGEAYKVKGRFDP